MQAGGVPEIEAFASVQLKHPFTVVSEQVAQVGSHAEQCIASPTGTKLFKHVQLAGPAITFVLEPQDMQLEKAPPEQVKQFELQGRQLSAVPQAPAIHTQVQGDVPDS